MNSQKQLNFLILMLIVFTVSSTSFAQKQGEVKEDQLKYLTNDQKQLLKDQQALIDKTKIILKENLTREQLTTLNNRSLSKQQRTKLLRQSLSQTQRDIISLNRTVLKKNRLNFRNSLTKRQRFRLRKFISDRKIDDRRRLVRRLRRLIRDNIDQ